MDPAGPEIERLYSREAPPAYRFAFMALTAVLVSGAVAAVIEEAGFGTIFDFGYEAHRARMVVILCAAVYLPLLIALPVFGKALHFDRKAGILFFSRQGLLLVRTARFRLDSLSNLSARRVLRLGAEKIDVGLVFADGAERHLFTLDRRDPESDEVVPLISSSTGLPIA